MKTGSAVMTALLLIAVSAPHIAAHHSISATYDSTKVMTITGTVTELKWMNPHTWISVDVKATDGKVVAWKVEMAPIGGLSKGGFQKDSISIASSVTLQVWPARDGSLFAAGRVLTLPDGKQFDVHDTFADFPQTR